MRRFFLWFMLISAVFLCISYAYADDAGSAAIQATEWTWEENGTAMFDGNVSLESPSDGSILMRLSADSLPSEEETGAVIFLSVNGKQLTLRKQTPEYKIPDGVQEISFTGCWIVPETCHAESVTVRLQILSDNGTILKEALFLAEREPQASSEKTQTETSGSFPIGTAILITAIAAVLVWIAAIVRIVKHKHHS